MQSNREFKNSSAELQYGLKPNNRAARRQEEKRQARLRKKGLSTKKVPLM